MVDWEITATTIFCEAVDDEVTVMVSQDGTVKCSGHQKYGQPDKETARAMKKKSQQLSKQLACEGAGCSRVTQQRDELLGKK
jgi:hypothetical protein